MICCYSVLAGQKLYLLDGSHSKTWTSSFCPWSSCHFQNHQLSIADAKVPENIPRSSSWVDRGEMSCSEVSRCEVSTKAWQLLVSIAGSDQKRVRIRWIWWMIHDDSCSVDQGCLKFGLLERRRLCCMFVSTRYVWGFVSTLRTGSTCRDPWSLPRLRLAKKATSSRGFEPIFGCAAVADALALSLEPIITIVEKMLTVVSIFSFKWVPIQPDPSKIFGLSVWEGESGNIFITCPGCFRFRWGA